MRGTNQDLHGNVPDACAAAMLIIDMISDFSFAGGSALAERGLPVARRLAEFKRRARAAGVPVIYVNDNYGRWRSNFGQQLAHTLDGTPGRAIAEALRPDDEDYFVLKPKHSGFYYTPLSLLLGYLGVDTLIVTGTRTESCVFFTANDAYMQEFALIVPPDGAVTFEDRDHEEALRLMGRDMKAELTPLAAIDLEKLGRTEKGGASGR